MRLIDADALKTLEYINKGNFNTVNGIGEWIDNAPTVEVRPTGQWKVDCTGYRGKEITSISYKCTQCGRGITWVNNGAFSHHKTPEDFLNEYPYCHCGARMDGTND